MVTQTEASLIEQENIRQEILKEQYINHIKVLKRSEVSKIRARETKKRNTSMPLSHQVYKALDELGREIKSKYKYFGAQIPNYAIGVLNAINKYKNDLKSGANKYTDGLIELFKNCHFKRATFKKILYKKLTPGYANKEIQNKIESYFSYTDKKTGNIMFKAKPFLEGKEFGRLIDKCRGDSYMFANHKQRSDNPSSLMISKIAFDFDAPSDLLSTITNKIPLNIIVMDKAELEKVNSGDKTKKIRKKDGKMKNIGEENKAHGFILLRDPIFVYNEASFKYYTDTRIRLIEYFKSLGLIDDPHGGKIVAKNVLNTSLYQSFLISDKKWTLKELNTALDELKVAKPKKIYKEKYISFKGKGVISEGIEKESRNCILYLLGIYSKTHNQEELLHFLFKENANFSLPLPAQEIRKIAKSIVNRSLVWRRKFEKKVELSKEYIKRQEQNYAQLMGTLTQMEKSRKKIKFIKSILPSYSPNIPRIAIARELQLLIQEHLGEKLSIEYLRKLIIRVDNWEKRYKKLLKLKESVSFQSVRDWLFKLEKGIIEGLNHILKSYIIYKLRNFGRYYKDFNIEHILKFLNLSPKTVHSLAQNYPTDNQKLQV